MRRDFCGYALVEDGPVRRAHARERGEALRRHRLEGRMFGYLTALEPVRGVGTDHASTWRCRCRCGRRVPIRTSDLTRARRRSCGSSRCTRASMAEAGIGKRFPRPKRVHVGMPCGVAPRGRGFVAKAWLDGGERYLGSYSTPELAHQAYLRACAGARSAGKRSS